MLAIKLMRLPVAVLASLSLVSFDLSAAQAEQEELSVSSEGIEASAGSPTAREEIIEAVGGDWEISRVVRDLVEPSLDLSNVDEVSATDTSELPEEYSDVFKNLSEVDAEDNEVDLRHPETGDLFSIGVKNLNPVAVDSGVVKAESIDGETTSVSHIAESGKGQVVVVARDESTTYEDFTYELPIGYRLDPASDGGYTLLNEAGEMEGRIEPAWAVDADGKRLPTHFELLEGNTIRQHIDSSDAAFPVVMDPSWGWWLATAGTCAVDLAPIAFAGPVGIAAKAGRVVAKINKLSKIAKYARAIKDAGGVGNVAVAVINKGIAVLKSKLPKAIASKIPGRVNKGKLARAAAVFWPVFTNQLWDYLGIGSCISLAREIANGFR